MSANLETMIESGEAAHFGKPRRKGGKTDITSEKNRMTDQIVSRL